MKKILYLCFMTCCIFNITTKAQILGDNNWESNAHFEDNFTYNNRTWRSDFKDLPLLKWMAFSFDSGVTHGTGEHQVYQKQNCIFDDTNNTMRLVATYEGGPLQCVDSNSPYYYVVPNGYSCHTDYNSLYYFSGEIDVLNYIYPNPNPQFLYGYFEIKCQLPVHRGAFPLENAIAERVNGIIKEEYLQDCTVKNIKEAKQVLSFVVKLYNEDRPHNSISNNVPNAVHENQDVKVERLCKNYYKKKDCQSNAEFSNSNCSVPLCSTSQLELENKSVNL